ncbi:MAG: tRNA (guanosine(37)-N1)-methyltransferase TrmD [Deltaproteobacteria bacterium]|nr:tRNA (guanosine(37)-N1)-methyltransferase TrmD [Deltaproteobacteria bacterium]
MSQFDWDVLTLFPEIIQVYAESGIIGRAQKDGKISVRVHLLRDFTRDKHRTVDDYPYGGGEGMVLKPEPIFRAVDLIRERQPETKVILLSPQGHVFNQAAAERLASKSRALTLICGRYEGVDDRVLTHLVDEEISIGDYVISGGELAALVLIDAVSRNLPGVVGDERSVVSDSFSGGLLKHAQYTRPEKYRGMKVPEILLSGHHAKIKRYQRYCALKKTFCSRPDLLEKAELSEEDREMLRRIREEDQEQ